MIQNSTSMLTFVLKGGELKEIEKEVQKNPKVAEVRKYQRLEQR